MYISVRIFVLIICYLISSHSQKAFSFSGMIGILVHGSSSPARVEIYD